MAKQVFRDFNFSTSDGMEAEARKVINMAQQWAAATEYELTELGIEAWVQKAVEQETGMQGVSYTTGVPAMIGAMMFVKGIWKKPGVWNVEDFDPDPFMEQLNKQGLPWHEVFDGDLEL